MTAIEQDQEALARAADVVRSRVGWNRFLGWLNRGRWAIPLLSIALVLVLRALGMTGGGEWLVVLGIVAVYGAAGWAWSRLRRPSRLEALSAWDDSGKRHELFSSAFAFLGDSVGSDQPLEEGKKLHVAQALKRLPEASAALRSDLPSPKMGWSWGLAALAIGLAFSPFLKGAKVPGETALSPEMLEEAERQAAELSKEKDQFEKIAGLTEEEKKEMSDLRESIDGLAEDLANSDGQTARDVLEGLEARARAAERLARDLGATSNEWASEEMLREMSQHPDTADLAASIKDRNAELAAGESGKLAGVLNEDEIKIETQERVTSALERTMAKATEEDHQKPVGERVGNASRKLQDKQARTAAREFEELAKHFRRIREREAAEEKLKELADKLREAGSSISGSKMEKMQKLASNGQGGGKAGENGQNLSPLSQAPMPNAPGMTPMTPTPTPGGQQPTGGSQQPIGTNLPIPGSQSPNGQGQQQGQGGVAMPIPGTGQQGKVQQGLAAGQGNQPGGQQPGQGAGLLAPIPGQSPGGGMPGASLGGAAGGTTSMGAQGGNQAGTGTMGLGNQTSEAIKAAQDAKIVAQVNDDGDSTVRAIEGQARSEQAQRQRQEMLVDFIKVEEQALDGASLPLSRREHVLRYFTAIRESFEENP